MAGAAIVLLLAAKIGSAECGELVFAIAREGADAGELRLLPTGQRTLVRRSLGGEQRYLVEPTAEGETHFLVAADGKQEPALFVSLERDEQDRPRREVLRRARPPWESDVMTDIVGWLEYHRGPAGRLTELVLYGSSGADLRWMTSDDLVEARVFFGYDLDGALVEAAVTRGWASSGAVEGPALVDRITFRRGPRGSWLGTASRLGRSAELARPCGTVIDERVATLLASPTLAPWVPWVYGHRGARRANLSR